MSCVSLLLSFLNNLTFLVKPWHPEGCAHIFIGEVTYSGLGRKGLLFLLCPFHHNMLVLAVRGEWLWGLGAEQGTRSCSRPQPTHTGRNMPDFTWAKKPWHIKCFSFLLAVVLKICILIYFCGKIIKQAGETGGKSDTLLTHSSGNSQASVSALNWIMKLNGNNKIAASNAAKHKENYVYMTISFLHNATTGAWLGCG